MKLFLFVSFYSILLLINTLLYLIEKSLFINDLTLKIRVKTLSIICKILCWVLGVKSDIDKKNHEYPCLIVSNHLSYLDILIISSNYNCSFVGSVDQVKQDLFFGYIAKISGCIFVDRKDKRKIKSEMINISEKLEKVSVCIFPEATTSNGENVLKFNSSFFQVCLNNQKNINLLTLNYKAIDNKSISNENRDYVFYYGKHIFLEHFLKFLKLKKIKVDITDRLISSNISDRKELADLSYKIIKNSYHSI
tara:strand:- start:638 stop:1387 length:750 start_codon:yes stop_codon:yes gene_type:complete